MHYDIEIWGCKNPIIASALKKERQKPLQKPEDKGTEKCREEKISDSRVY